VWLGVAGFVALAAALVRWPAGLAPALVLLAVPWGFALAERPSAAATVLAGAGLLVTGELAGWSLDLVSVVTPSYGDAGRLALRTAALAAAGAAASVVLLAVSALPAPGSLLRLVVGVSAALAVIAFLAVRRWEAS
jgi:hypothetical protein